MSSITRGCGRGRWCGGDLGEDVTQEENGGGGVGAGGGRRRGRGRDGSSAGRPLDLRAHLAVLHPRCVPDLRAACKEGGKGGSMGGGVRRERGRGKNGKLKADARMERADARMHGWRGERRSSFFS
jgi:hypothetical protein